LKFSKAGVFRKTLGGFPFDDMFIRLDIMPAFCRRADTRTLTGNLIRVEALSTP